MAKVAEKKFGKEKSVLVVAQKLSNDVESGRTMVYTAQRIASMVYGINELISSDPELRFLYQNQSKRINGDSKNGLESLGNHITAVIPNLELLVALSNFSRDELLTLCSTWESLGKDPYKMDERKSMVRALLDDLQLFKRMYMKESNNQTEESLSKPKGLKTFPILGGEPSIASTHLPTAQEDVLKESLAKEIERANNIQEEHQIKSPQSQTQMSTKQTTQTEDDLGLALGMKKPLSNYITEISDWFPFLKNCNTSLCESMLSCKTCTLKRQCDKLVRMLENMKDLRYKWIEMWHKFELYGKGVS